MLSIATIYLSVYFRVLNKNNFCHGAHFLLLFAFYNYIGGKIKSDDSTKRYTGGNRSLCGFSPTVRESLVTLLKSDVLPDIPVQNSKVVFV